MINGILDILTFVNKLISIKDSVVEIKKVIDNKDRGKLDIVNAISHGVFAGMQITDICVNHTSLSKKTSLSTQKNITNWSGRASVVCLVTKRAVYYNKHQWTWVEFGLQSTLDLGLNDYICQKRDSNIGRGIFIVSSGIRIFFNLLAIKDMLCLGGTASKYIFKKSITAVNYLRSKILSSSNQKKGTTGLMSSTSSQNVPLNQMALLSERSSLSGQDDLKPITKNDLSNHSILESEEGVKLIHEIGVVVSKYELYKNNDQKFLEELKEIPGCIAGDEWNWICFIDKKPIRFIVGNNKCEFEETTLMNWIDEHPNEKPPHWPPNEPFEPFSYKKIEKDQEKIDKRILEIVKALSKDYNGTCDNLPQENLGWNYVDEETDKKNK